MALREGQDCAQACGTLIDDRVNGNVEAYEAVVDEIKAIRERRAG